MSMAAMHEEMHAAANAEQEDQRQIADDMRLMLLPQEVSGNGKETGQSEAVTEAQ